jgi:uncharacterized protein (TIGR03435 family)
MSFQGRIISAFIFVLLFASGTAPGQASTAKGKLAFDVATVKPSPPLDPQKIAADMQAGKMPHIGAFVTASRAEYIQMTLKNLIAIAYGVKPYQITGPDWLGSDRFDVEATLPEGASKDEAPAMLQALLEERFKLNAHHDTEEHKVLALVVGKGGPKLKETSEQPKPIDESAPLKPNQMMVNGAEGPIKVTRNPDGSMTLDMGARGTMTQRFDAENRALRIDSSMVTMAGFADTLSSILAQMGGEQVVDMTGLKGNYAVSIELSLADLMSIARSAGIAPPPPPNGGAAANAGPAAAASDPSGGTSVFQSVEQMGLKLEERKAPVEQLVIDHVEKTPTEN